MSTAIRRATIDRNRWPVCVQIDSWAANYADVHDDDSWVRYDTVDIDYVWFYALHMYKGNSCLF